MSEWERWRGDLAARVLALADGERVHVDVTGVPERSAVTRPRRMFGLVAPRTRSERPWVELVRVEQHLRGQLVGATAVGGPYPMTEDERDRVADLGWHAPLSQGTTHYERWWPDDVAEEAYLPPALADRAAEAVVLAVREVLGAQGPADVEIARARRG